MEVITEFPSVVHKLFFRGLRSFLHRPYSKYGLENCVSEGLEE